MSDTYKYCIKCDGIMGYPDPVEVLSGEHRCRNGHDNGIDDEDRAQVLIEIYRNLQRPSNYKHWKTRKGKRPRIFN